MKGWNVHQYIYFMLVYEWVWFCTLSAWYDYMKETLYNESLVAAGGGGGKSLASLDILECSLCFTCSSSGNQTQNHAYPPSLHLHHHQGPAFAGLSPGTWGWCLRYCCAPHLRDLKKLEIVGAVTTIPSLRPSHFQHLNGPLIQHRTLHSYQQQVEVSMEIQHHLPLLYCPLLGASTCQKGVPIHPGYCSVHILLHFAILILLQKK